jgi:hypothetical protein
MWTAQVIQQPYPHGERAAGRIFRSFIVVWNVVFFLTCAPSANLWKRLQVTLGDKGASYLLHCKPKNDFPSPRQSVPQTSVSARFPSIELPRRSIFTCNAGRLQYLAVLATDLASRAANVDLTCLHQPLHNALPITSQELGFAFRAPSGADSTSFSMPLWQS